MLPWWWLLASYKYSLIDLQLNPIFNKPLIFQEILRRWPISPIQHHYFFDKLLILVTNLTLCRSTERRCL